MWPLSHSGEGLSCVQRFFDVPSALLGDQGEWCFRFLRLMFWSERSSWRAWIIPRPNKMQARAPKTSLGYPRIIRWRVHGLKTSDSQVENSLFQWYVDGARRGGISYFAELVVNAPFPNLVRFPCRCGVRKHSSSTGLCSNYRAHST